MFAIKRCGELETIAHLLLDCPFSAEIWEKAPIVTLGDRVSTTPFRDWLSTNVSKGALPPLGLTTSPLAPWLLWNIWTARNKLIFEGKAYQVEDIIAKAVTDAKEWESANMGKTKKKEKKTLDCKKLSSIPSCWIDGAWQEDTQIGGMGWIIKNAAGEVICRGSSNRSHVSSALMSEALALREVLKKAKELNLQSLQVFSDSQVLILTLRSGRDMNEIAGVLQDIKVLATLFCPVSFCYIPRSDNVQADTLARSGLGRFINAG